MSIEEKLDRIERDVVYLKDVVEQLDKRLAEFRTIWRRGLNPSIGGSIT